MREPNLFNYVDYRDYIKAWTRARGGRTQARLAKSLGCAQGYISMVLSGQRTLSDELVEPLIGVLKLEGDEVEYLRLLLRQAHGAEVDAQRAASQALALRRDHFATELVDEALRVFRNPLCVAIAELVRCRGGKVGTAWLAESLLPAVSLTQAQRALDTLLSLGLVRYGPDGRLVRCDSDLKTPSQETLEGFSDALKAMHVRMSHLACEALESLHRDERHFNAATMVVPLDVLPAIKVRLDRFQKEILHLCAQAQVQEPQPQSGQRAEAVYRLNMQLFPLSVWIPCEDGDS